jgi:hypothetical protein
MSFKEKSIWISLIATALIFGYYAIRVFQIETNQNVGHAEMVLFTLTIIISIIVVEIVSHILLAIAHRPETADERDEAIELKATRIAYFLLVIGVFAAVGQFWFSPTPPFICHILLFSFILAEIASDITRLVYYRRGI